MAHEITTTDGLVLHRNRAWHGLGTIVEDAPTPRQALKLAGMEWGIESVPMWIKNDDGELVQVPGKVANLRADTQEFLGVVGDGYQPVSNFDLAQFCYELGGASDDVRVETAGSIRGGARVWMLCKGKPFEAMRGDEVWPYLLVSNGHDGTASFRVTPTTVRVVCSNTLHMVIPQNDGQMSMDYQDCSFVIRHTTNVLARVDECREALRRFAEARERTADQTRFLASREVTDRDIQAFFATMFTHEFGTLDMPEDPTEQQVKQIERRRRKAESAWDSFSRRWDDEAAIAGTTWWNTFNAWSGLVQHDMKARGKDDLDRVEKRQKANLFGLNAERTSRAFSLAISLAS